MAVPKRTFRHRYPFIYRNLIFGTFVFVTFGIPFIYAAQQPQKLEDHEYNEAMKRAWNEKFKDKWYVPRWK